METLIRELVLILPPTSLILLLVVIWQFKTLNKKDEKIFDLFSGLNKHSDAIQRLLGVLEGRRIA